MSKKIVLCGPDFAKDVERMQGESLRFAFLPKADCFTEADYSRLYAECSDADLLIVAMFGSAHDTITCLDWEAIPCPKACWSLDSHHQWPEERRYRHHFDAFFVAHSPYCKFFDADRVHWLPCSFFQLETNSLLDALKSDPFAAAREFDVVFPHSLYLAGSRAIRTSFARSFLEDRHAFCGPVEPGMPYIRKIQSARVVLNLPLFDDLNIRNFEAWALNRVLLTPHVPDMDRIAAPAEGTVFFNADFSDFRQKLELALDLAGQPLHTASFVLNGHMLVHRYAAIINTVLGTAVRVKDVTVDETGGPEPVPASPVNGGGTPVRVPPLSGAFGHCADSGEQPGGSRTPDAAAVKRLLYVRLDGIGDGILACGLLAALPRVFPQAEITVVCDRAAAPLYAHAPMVSGTISLETGKLHEPGYLEEALDRLRACRADLLFSSALSPKRQACELMLGAGLPIVSTAIETANLLPEKKALFEQAVTCLVPVESETRLDMDRHRHMLEELGAPCDGLTPVMWLADEDAAVADRLWRECGFLPEKTVAFFAGSGAEQKNYYRYGEAVAPVFARHGFSVAALGGPGDRRINEENLEAFARHGVPVANLSGKGSLRGDAAFLRDCCFALGADTAMAHMACVFGIPLVALVPGAYSGRFLPYAPNTTAVCLPLECSGCNWNCPYDEPHCVRGILPETLREAVEDRLAQRDRPQKTLFMQNPETWTRRESGPGWKSPAEFIQVYKKRPEKLVVKISR